MGAHIVNGQFQSDKYPTCPPGKVPLSVKDPMAQPELWSYAQKRRSVDAEFSEDLEMALKAAGYEPRHMSMNPERHPHIEELGRELWLVCPMCCERTFLLETGVVKTVSEIVSILNMCVEYGRAHAQVPKEIR